MPAPVSITAPNSPKKRGGKTSYGGSRPSPSGGHTAPAQSTPTVTTVSSSGQVISTSGPGSPSTAHLRSHLQAVHRVRLQRKALRIITQHKAKLARDEVKFERVARNPLEKLGLIAKRQFGLKPTENPDFGGVDSAAHVDGSQHYKGDAIDFIDPKDPTPQNNSPALDQFARYVDKKWGKRIDAEYYDPAGFPSPSNDHYNHLHVGMTVKGGTHGTLNPATPAQFDGGAGGGLKPKIVPVKGAKKPEMSRAKALTVLSSLPADKRMALPRNVKRAVANQPIDKFHGKPLLGTPPRKQVRRAAAKGTLRKVNGELATPQVRKVEKEYARLSKQKGGVKITGLANADQTKFAETLAKEMHYDPHFVAAWLKGEGGNLTPGDHNWLNIGWYGGSPHGPALDPSQGGAPEFKAGPVQAAKATAKWLRGQWGSQYSYQAAPSLVAAMKGAEGADPQTAIAALAASGWGSSTSLTEASLANTTGTRKLPPPGTLKKLAATKAEAEKLGLPLGKSKPDPLNAFHGQVKQQLKIVEGAIKSGKSTIDKGPGTLVRDSQGSAGGAPAPMSIGHEPEIAARLKLLSAKYGVTVHVISGSRTPAGSVSVGGFADDPHTRGEAADIGINGSSLASAGTLTEAQYNSVGLHRPYYPASANEINHVELLNGGTPTFGGSTSASPSAVSSGSTATLASTTSSASGGSVAGGTAARKSHKPTGAEILAKLKKYGVGTTAPTTSTSSATLAELEKRYGAPTV